MITKFKIFENLDDEKRWYALVVNKDDVERDYNHIKKLGIKIFFYNGSDKNIFFLIYVNKKTIKQIGLPYLTPTNDVKLKLDNYNDTIPDIEKWIKNYNYKKTIEKYNI